MLNETQNARTKKEEPRIKMLTTQIIKKKMCGINEENKNAMQLHIAIWN